VTSALLRTSELFWSVFRTWSDGQEVPTNLQNEGVERHRLTCLAGFIALDASLARCWRLSFASEWGETGTYLKALLAQPTELDPFLAVTSPAFRRGQWMATLRFLANTGDPLRFSPTFADVATLLLVTSPSRLQDPEFVTFAQDLLRLQKLRNTCVHTGRAFTELEARESLRLLSRVGRELETRLYPGLAPHRPTVTRRAA